MFFHVGTDNWILLLQRFASFKDVEQHAAWLGSMEMISPFTSNIISAFKLCSCGCDLLHPGQLHWARLFETRFLPPQRRFSPNTNSGVTDNAMTSKHHASISRRAYILNTSSQPSSDFFPPEKDLNPGLSKLRLGRKKKTLCSKSRRTVVVCKLRRLPQDQRQINIQHATRQMSLVWLMHLTDRWGTSTSTRFKYTT